MSDVISIGFAGALVIVTLVSVTETQKLVLANYKSEHNEDLKKFTNKWFNFVNNIKIEEPLFEQLQSTSNWNEIERDWQFEDLILNHLPSEVEYLQKNWDDFKCEYDTFSRQWSNLHLELDQIIQTETGSHAYNPKVNKNGYSRGSIDLCIICIYMQNSDEINTHKISLRDEIYMLILTENSKSLAIGDEKYLDDFIKDLSNLTTSETFINAHNEKVNRLINDGILLKASKKSVYKDLDMILTYKNLPGYCNRLIGN